MRREDPNATGNVDTTVARPLLAESPKGIELKIERGDDTNLETTVFIKDPNAGPKSQPKDKYYLIYMILLLFGVANLLPWNVFITATDYFVDYKLNTNETFNTTYQIKFTFYVGIVSQTTNVLMNLFNIIISLGGNPKNRIPYTVMLCAAAIVFHIFMAIIESQSWPIEFFFLTCVSVFVMFVATGIMNSCVYYVAALFPMEYINAIILGNNFSGIFTSVASILSKLSTPNLRIAAIYYFLAAFIVLMLAFIGYFVMHRTDFYRFFIKRSEEIRKKNIDESSTSKHSVPYWLIIKQIWFMLFCIWLNFFSTLAIFPNFQLGIKQSNESFFIGSYYYNNVLIFLTFNICVTLGNLLPKLIRVPGPKLLPIPVIARAVLVFIFFAFCNFEPSKRNHIPILFNNDWVYWAASAIHSFLFGYFTSLLMMYTPQLVAPEHQGPASMIAALMIAVGVMTGIYFYAVLEFIVLL